MKKIQLGKTGEMVSPLCLGTLYMGTKEDRETSHRILDQYSDAGGSFLDSANIYSFWIADRFKGGESDALVGQWMKDRGNREKMFVTGKMGISYPGQTQGLTAIQIETECEKSLRLMQTDYIDLYFAHADDWETPQEEALEAFHQMIKKGKVRHIGASNFESWRLARANTLGEMKDLTTYSVLQQRHTYLKPKTDSDFALQVVLSDDMIDYCGKNEIAIMAYTATLQGSYNKDSKREIPDSYNTAQNQRRLNELYTIAEEAEASPLQIVLAWMMHSTPRIIPLITGSTKEQMDENLDSIKVQLDTDQMKRLNSAGDYQDISQLNKG